MVTRAKTHLSPEQKAALLEDLENMHGPNQELIRIHREAGLSMYGQDRRFPGEFVELAPDGRLFIVRPENDAWVRVREVSRKGG